MRRLFTISLIAVLSAGFTLYSPREDRQKQLYYYKSDLSSYELKVSEWKKVIESLEARKKSAEGKIKILSELIESIKSGDTRDEILKQEAEFIAKREKIDKLKDEFRKRILWLYKKGPDYQYQLLFTTDSPAKFYARLQYLNKLTEARKTDFEKIKYEEVAYAESKKIKGYRKSEIMRYISLRKEDQTQLLLEKMNIEDSLSILKTGLENFSYQAQKIKRVVADMEFSLSVDFEAPEYELKTTPDYTKTDFEKLKGMLIFPVSSTDIKNDFGKSIDHETGTVINNEGIDVRIAANSEVRCVADGVVENIVEIPLYRKLIIINHGGNYRTLYGIVDKINVKIKDQVQAGKVIALTSSNLNGQMFHFEIRKGVTAEDPKYWVSRVRLKK